MDKRMLVVMAILMITFIGFGIIIPVMPEIILETASSNAEIHNGAILAIYSLVSFILSPVWGGWSDRIGRRKIIIVGLIGFSISFLMFGLVAGNLVLMYVARALGGLFSGAVTSVIVAYVADITTAETRTKGMAFVGISIGFGFMIGPAIGGMLSVISYQTPFFVAAALSLLTTLLAITILKDTDARVSKDEPRVSRWKAFEGVSKYLYVLAFFVTFTLAFIEATLQLFGIERFDVTPGQVGLMFLYSGLAGAVIQGGVIRRYVKPGQEPKFIVAGLIISAIGFFMLLGAHSFTWATISIVVFGIGNAITRPCITSLITLKTRVSVGVASGLSNSMDSLGRIAGPLIGAFLFSFSITLPYAVAGVLSLLALLLVYYYKQADRNANKLVEQ
ncbi:MFS transporter [Paenibacillus camelliae]|uniref:MFS transporter n=1 Tax=Paenibacillus camelliae TaxID=512410 RepID=UPI002042202F|nr:MFS transporter [Paenibacillus camelliae]MCM3632190.1 MFS transporter [Paenibacillus camelliae]